MGQKVNPRGFRIGPLYTWNSRWFADDKDYKTLLVSDIKLRDKLFVRYRKAGLASVELERSINKIKITLHVSRPGIVIGRGGTGLEDLKKLIKKQLSIDLKKRDAKKKTDKTKIEISVEPIKEPNLNAHLVATYIADQLVRRIPHKRVCLNALDRIMSAGAKGAKILLSGRIAGAEISRKEKFQEGSVPLSTIREDIDYAQIPSLTKSGYIGVKVWICKK